MNPFENSPTQPEEIQVGALESISRAEIDMAIATARRYPRNVVAVKKEMLSIATMDQETAEACFYTLPRGGKEIEGPSVRLAEIAVSCYGNLRAGSRVLQCVTTGDNPHVVIQAVAMDLEKNISISIEKRRRITKKKSKNQIDEDDINLAANAGSAIAFRDAVFKIVPLALIKPVFQAAKKVAIGDASTLTKKRDAWIAHFAKMGISKERLLEKLEYKDVDEIQLKDIELLNGLHNAIRDGEVQLDEAFPVVKAPVQGGSVKSPTNQATAQQTTSKPAETKAETTTTPEKAPEQTQGETQPEQGSGQTEQAGEEAGGEDFPQGEFVANPNESDDLQSVRLLMHRAGVTDNQVVAWCRVQKMAKDDQKKLGDLSTAKLKVIQSAWPNKLAEIKAQPK